MSKAYMGGTRDGAESPKFNQPTTTEFDAPIIKAQTHMQQPDPANKLEKGGPMTPSIKIPSEQPSQSEISSKPKSQVKPQKGKKKDKEIPIMDMLKDHRINYKKHYDQRQAEYTTAKWDHESVVEEMKAATIKCVKYNYSLDAGVQNFLQFDGLIKLS